MLHVAWNVFKNSGNIETFLLLKEIEQSPKTNEITEEEESLAETDSPIS